MSELTASSNCPACRRLAHRQWMRGGRRRHRTHPLAPSWTDWGWFDNRTNSDWRRPLCQRIPRPKGQESYRLMAVGTYGFLCEKGLETNIITIPANVRKIANAERRFTTERISCRIPVRTKSGRP